MERRKLNMKPNNAPHDSWSLLLGDLGIAEQNQQESAVEVPNREMPVVAQETVKPMSVTEISQPPSESVFGKSVDSFGAGLFDDAPATAPAVPAPAASKAVEDDAPAETPKSGKKRFFDRFPKMNLFGSSGKETLEAVVESAKSPSLSGKSFTSNKLEKVPATPGRASRKKNEEPAGPPKNSNNEEATNPAPNENPWSTIASQVDALSSPESTPAAPKSEKPARRESRSAKKTGAADRPEDRLEGRQRGRRQTPSMFDDGVTESAESVALKGLMAGGQRGDDAEAEERLSSMLASKPAASTDRPARGRRGRVEAAAVDTAALAGDQRVPEPVEDDDPFAAFHANDPAAVPSTRSRRSSRSEARTTESRTDRRSEERDAPRTQETRGRRGSRYVDRAALESGHDSSYLQEREHVQEPYHEEPEPPRSRGRGRRVETERLERDAPERDVSENVDYAQVHKNMPGWDDTISALIDSNIARRGNQRPQRNGRR